MQDNQELDVTLFDSTEVYEEKILPLVIQLKEACEAIGIPFVMMFCFSHVHKDKDCDHGVTLVIDTEPGKVPVKMHAAAMMAQAEDDEALIAMQLLDRTQKVFEKFAQQRSAKFN